jgi:phosphohistidine phosphatase
MKRLILIRHAKSDWDDPFNGDHNRRLNARGHRAAGLVGAWLAEHGYLPDHVQCSTATRCIETWQEIKEAADLDLSPEYEKGIYHASSDVMLKILSRAEGDTVMMLGHNPGISDFAERLIKGPAPDHQKFYQYPTAAVTILDFDVDDWAYVNFGEGKLVEFIVPKDLEK